MNRIKDERIKFYFQHEERIREWANLETEVNEFVDGFYRSLKDDLDAALRSGGIADDGVESFRSGGNRPGLCLRRRTWPSGDDGVYLKLEWYRKAGFPPNGELDCGVVTNVKWTCPVFTDG